MTWPMSEFSASFPFSFPGERCEEFALRLFMQALCLRFFSVDSAEFLFFQGNAYGEACHIATEEDETKEEDLSS